MDETSNPYALVIETVGSWGWEKTDAWLYPDFHAALWGMRRWVRSWVDDEYPGTYDEDMAEEHNLDEMAEGDLQQFVSDICTSFEDVPEEMPSIMGFSTSKAP